MTILLVWLCGVFVIGFVCAALNVPFTFRNVGYILAWMLIGISIVFQLLPPAIVLCLPETKEEKAKYLRQAA